MTNFENYREYPETPELEDFKFDYLYYDEQPEVQADEKLSVASMLDTPLTELIDNKRMTNLLSDYGINNVHDFIETEAGFTDLPGIGYGTVERIDGMIRHSYGFDSRDNSMGIYERTGARDHEIAARHIQVGPNELLGIESKGRMRDYIDSEILDGLTLDDFLNADLDSVEELVKEGLLAGRTEVAQTIIEEMINTKDRFDDHRERQAQFETQLEADRREYNESRELADRAAYRFDNPSYYS
jgi:hypothetical protein